MKRLNLTQAIRVFSVFGILSLVLTIANIIGRISVGENMENLVLDYVTIIAWIFLLFGLFGTYLSQVDDLGVIGFIGLLTIVVSTAWVIGIVAVHAFAFPVIHDLDPSLVSNDMPSSDLPSPIREATITSSYAGIVGTVLYGLSVLLKSKVTRWPGVLLVLIGISSMLESQFEILGLIGYLGLPVAVFWMCVKVLKTTKSPAIPLSTQQQA
jgi:hypothetical protein